MCNKEVCFQHLSNSFKMVSPAIRFWAKFWPAYTFELCISVVDIPVKNKASCQKPRNKLMLVWRMPLGSEIPKMPQIVAESVVAKHEHLCSICNLKVLSHFLKKLLQGPRGVGAPASILWKCKLRHNSQIFAFIFHSVSHQDFCCYLECYDITEANLLKSLQFELDIIYVWY